jgi:hypothetical protein
MRVYYIDNLDPAFMHARPGTFVRVATVQATQKSDVGALSERKHFFQHPIWPTEI